MPWTAHIDGGSRGNPGPSGAGVHIADANGQTAFAAGLFLGKLTNNQAEYQGLLAALDVLIRAGAQDVEIVSDSELMVHQINGRYRVKSPGLLPLFEQARKNLLKFPKWKMLHVLRGENVNADELANKAMDAKRDVIAVDRIGGKTTSPAPPPTSLFDQAAAPTRSAPPPPSPRGSSRDVEMYVMRAPQPRGCPAGMNRNSTFRFDTKTPAGCCVDACAAVLDAVLAIQAGDIPGPATPECAREGCGAVFEVRRAQ